MQSAIDENGRPENGDGGDLKALFVRDTPSFARVDVEAVLRDSVSESRDSVIHPMNCVRQDMPSAVGDVATTKPRFQRRATMLKRMSVLGACAACIGLAIVIGLSSGNTVLAQVQNAIKKVKTASYSISRSEGEQPPMTWKVKLLGDNLCRCEQANGIYVVFDIQAKKFMEVNPVESKVRITENLPVPDGFSILAKLANPNSIAVKGQPLDREFNGKKTPGIVVEENGVRYNVWIDPATKLPLEFERVQPESKGNLPALTLPEFKEKWTEFRFDEPIDKSLFVFEAPKGFAVETRVAPKGGVEEVANEAAKEDRRRMEKARDEAALKAKGN